MEIIIAVLVGVGLGWLLGRRSVAPADTAEAARSGRRPTKKQRLILASLPPDPPRPTLDDLVAVELEETGAGRIPGAGDLQPPVALKVFRRDQPELGDVAPERLRFVVEDGVAPGEATVDQVRLVTDP